MKILKLSKIGFKQIVAHKKQSIMVILTIGILFGVLMSVDLVFQGLENRLFEVATKKTGEGVELVNFICDRNQMDKCVSRTEIDMKLTGYKGVETGGVIKIYEVENTYIMTIDQPSAEKYKNIEIPQNTIIALASFDYAYKLVNPTKEEYFLSERKQISVDEMKKTKEKVLGKMFKNENLKINYHVIGITLSQGGKMVLAEETPDLNLLDMVLSQIGGGSFTPLVFIENEAMRNYLKENTPINKGIIIKFNNTEVANQYIEENLKQDIIELFSNKINIYQTFQTIRNLFYIIKIILVVVAVMITLFTFIKIIDQDTQVITLYRVLGATKVDVMFIYFIYLLGVCLCALLYALMIGVVIAMIVGEWNIGALTHELKVFYELEEIKTGLLLGWNKSIVLMGIIMLVINPICLFLSCDRFSMKYISTRLKQ